MTRYQRISLLLFTALFVYVEASQARLIRTTGRASLSRDDGQSIYYFGPESLNIVGITVDAYDNRFSSSVSDIRSPIDQNRGVAAVPNSCIKGVQEQQKLVIEDEIFDLENQIFELEAIDPVDNAAKITGLETRISQLNARISNDPCTWEFEEGELLNLFGAFSMFFDISAFPFFTDSDFPFPDPTLEYAVDWSITGGPNGVDLRLPGEVNLEEEPRTPADGESFRTGSGVFLNAGPFDQLVPGDYNVSVNVALTGVGGAPIAGGFFLESVPEDIIWEENWADNPAFEAFLKDPANYVNGDVDNGDFLPGIVFPDDIIIGYDTFRRFPDEPASAPTSFSSAVERLRIIPAAISDDPAVVNSPSTLACALGGLLLIYAGRRRRAATHTGLPA